MKNLLLIRYPGGKQYLLKFLLPFIPNHKYYLEVFGGGASVLLNKPKSYFEVYNDIDESLVNLFRVIRDKSKYKLFKEKLRYVLYARSEFEKALENLYTHDDVDRAVNFYIVNRMSFASMGKSWSHSLGSPQWSFPPSAWENAKKRIDEIYDRFKSVQIENSDWFEVMNRYNWKESSFAYLDPPYILPDKGKNGYYNQSFSIEDHEN